MPTSAADALHSRLRLETQPAHAALDRSLQACQFFSSLAGYEAYLRGMLALQSDAENRLQQLNAALIVPDWPERQRAHLACADLAALQDMTVTAASAIRLNMSEDSAFLDLADSPAQVLGIMYVLEGATLGGAVLLKTAVSLGVSAEHGASFLASYGARRGLMWRRFLQCLSFWEGRGIDQTQVVGAAHQTFTAASAYLTGPRSHLASTTTSAKALPPAV